ncbi:glycoside hydrolase family 36 protein [Curtobacterium flaccumfaciens]|uniref:glycoside hydrolase family 36 protein n=1 Tax=Curtobacterium flaccumfaciens TaxID=2035 RepID=UPI001E564E58|nr:glycoside hydrolase family 36 protein [Curtobacterium allii]MCE0459464.1 alpha-galactosidase [Curtobacterium allii]
MQPRDITAAPPTSVQLDNLHLTWADDQPVAISRLGPADFIGHGGTELVQLFTAAEQRARTSQAYLRSAVGRRLRYVAHERRNHDDRHELVIEQSDPTTQLTVLTSIVRPIDADVYQLRSTVRNDGAQPVVITALSATCVAVGSEHSDLDAADISRARSEWLAEDRWETAPLRQYLPNLSLPIHGQDGRGRFGVTSHGSWSTGEHLPVGFISNTSKNVTIGWQIETSSGWHWELCQTQESAALTLLGPTELEHSFSVTLAPADTFDGVPCAITAAPGSLTDANNELTAYRRWLRRHHGAEDNLPLVYNDFMNTLMGEQSAAALLPLIHAAGRAGAEVFCIDAGWYADPTDGDWWSSVGSWQQADDRFDGDFDAILRQIHALGMRSGIWLEPEVIGVRSPLADTLPDDAFFSLHGTRVQEHERFHLDFRSRAARAHLDAVVDGLVDKGVSYFKFDYNINPGIGTDRHGDGPGSGLLGHSRAYAEWLVDLRRRHPHVSIENCSSGAMRADYSLLAVTQLQSTSDQQDFRRYPPIAASAPLSIAPEQCGNWAYPAAQMSDDETAFTLVSGLSGRLYLSGFLDELRPEQTALVHSAVQRHRQWRPWLARATPYWPRGLPGWDDDLIIVGLRDEDTDRLFIWNRATRPAEVHLPARTADWRQVFPPAVPNAATTEQGDAFELAAGPSAVVLERTVRGEATTKVL